MLAGLAKPESGINNDSLTVDPGKIASMNPGL